MRITYLDKKTITTKFGDKEKYSVTVEKDGRPFYFDSWVGKWNQNWRVGDDLNPTKEQWKSREWNGKTYWTLEQLKIDWGNELMKVNEKLDRVLAHLGDAPAVTPQKAHANLVVQQAVDMLGGRVVEDEIPTINMGEPENEIRLEDVPF